ncbi:uncharacterized protein [Panulirus ornatus]|uniref:uncharacterized protein n=1 Tax=Panulirus ornatus TaxID=150431 RepID=UPI003A8A9FA8
MSILALLLLHWLVLQGLAAFTTPVGGGAAAATTRRGSLDANRSILKIVEALQELRQTLKEGEVDPAAPTDSDPATEAAERTRNLTLALEELVQAVHTNTRALREAQKLHEGVRCELPFFPVGSECFYVNPYQRVSWGEARKFCQGLGAELAQPSDVNKLRATLLHKFPEDRYQFFWLGAMEAMGKEGNWSWLSQVAVPIREWSEGQPDGGNENCVVLSRDEYPALHDSPCYTHTMFICQAPPAPM